MREDLVNHVLLLLAADTKAQLRSVSSRWNAKHAGFHTVVSTMKESIFYIGQRLIPYSEDVKKRKGTLRYVGELHTDRLKRFWLGMELDFFPSAQDDTIREKEDEDTDLFLDPPGCLGGIQYFQLNDHDNEKLTSCTLCTRFQPIMPPTLFLLSSNINAKQLGSSFLEEVQQRYGRVMTQEDHLDLWNAPLIEVCGRRLEFVGFDHAARHFENIYQLNYIDLEGGSVRYAGLFPIRSPDSFSEKSKGDTVYRIFSHVQRLSLRHNLLSNVEELHKILWLMPKLEWLDLSRNKFQRTPYSFSSKNRIAFQQCNSIWLGLPSSRRFLHLRVLDLKETNIHWEDVLFMVQCFPNVVKLNLSGNIQLFNTSSSNTILQHSKNFLGKKESTKIQEIELQYCGLLSYEHIRAVCEMFPHMTRLNLNGNCLPDISHDTMVSLQGETVTSFSSLQDLFLQDNHIQHLDTLYSLSQLVPHLNNLRLQGNPFYESHQDLSKRQKEIVQTVQSHQVDVSILRYFLITLFPRLTRLNGSDILSYERKESELYFLALCSRHHSLVKILDPENIHQQRLKQTYHDICLSPTEKNNPKKNCIASRRVTVRFIRLDDGDNQQCSGTLEFRKTLPLWLSVKNIKELVEYQFQIERDKQRLFLSHSQYCGRRTDLLDDEATLEMYSVDDNSSIYVTSKSK